MSGTTNSLAIILLLPLLGACSEPAPEVAPEAVESEAQSEVLEATAADPDRYELVAETDRARVVRIQYGPGEESVMHSHGDHVAVFLTTADSEFRALDGTVEALQAVAGSHLFVAAGAHHPRNLGDTPFEAVAIELKPSDSSADSEATETGPDSTVVDSEHYVTEFENDRIRVVRATYGPGEASAMHYHPEHIAVSMTDQHFEFELPDGSTQEIQVKAGEHIVAPAGQHLPENLTDETAVVIIVEFKS